MSILNISLDLSKRFGITEFGARSRENGPGKDGPTFQRLVVLRLLVLELGEGGSWSHDPILASINYGDPDNANLDKIIIFA